MRTPHPHLDTVTPSVFAGFRFPPEVIVLAVRWYLRFGLLPPFVLARYLPDGRLDRGHAGVRAGQTVDRPMQAQPAQVEVICEAMWVVPSRPATGRAFTWARGSRDAMQRGACLPLTAAVPAALRPAKGRLG